ncbi:hypothetical protein G3I40_31165, partial [Streptomyces sp. SID14478]|uniref:hypothetical protein n=1 Tax=Streptomyces sp. SID14478 TaxID=2706073 RepID=UPI0013DA9CEC
MRDQNDKYGPDGRDVRADGCDSGDPAESAREHRLSDDGTGEAAIHARIAARLAAMSGDPAQPPPPYA